MSSGYMTLDLSANLKVLKMLDKDLGQKYNCPSRYQVEGKTMLSETYLWGE